MWIDYGTFKNLVGEAYVVEPRSIAPEAKPAVDPRQTRQAQMARILDQPVCGRLRLSWQGDRPIIEGFARPEDGAAVRERAAALAPNLEWRVRATPFPACEAEMLLTEGQTREGEQLGISRPSQPLLTASEVTLAEDDLFSIEVETDASRPYVQVFYIQADGSAVELYRGTPAADADGRRRIRAGGSGASDWKFQVAAPFGDEALVAVASQGPVIADKLGHEATERQFLSRLRTALVAAGGSAERPAATLQRLRTLAKGQAAARRDHSKINLAGGR
jgi:hypothetical protein